jgi:hypothetical protein
MPPRDLNSQSQPAGGRRPTLPTGQSLRSALCIRNTIMFCNHRNLADLLSGNQLNTANEFKKKYVSSVLKVKQ